MLDDKLKTNERRMRLAMDIFEDRALLLQYYQKQADEFRMRHVAIWEEIKHYTWLLSLLLGWPVALFSAKDLAAAWKLVPYFIFLPVLGFFFSLIAFFVIRREYTFYNDSEAKLLYIEKRLGLASCEGFLDRRLKKAAEKDQFTVERYVNEVNPIGTYLPWKARIRALFLLGFIVYAIIAVAEIIFCLSLLLRVAKPVSP